MKTIILPLYSATDAKTKFRVWRSGSTFLDLICDPIEQGNLFQHQIMHCDPKHTKDCGTLSRVAQAASSIDLGASSAWQITDWAHKLHDTIPELELHVPEDCGHFAMEYQPEKVSALLVDFLNRQG